MISFLAGEVGPGDVHLVGCGDVAPLPDEVMGGALHGGPSRDRR